MRILSKIYRSKMNKAVAIMGRALLIVFLCGLMIAVWYGPQVAGIPQKYFDYYSDKVFPKVAVLGNCMCNGFSISLTEYFAVIGSVVVIILAVLFVVVFVKKIIFEKKGEAGAFLYKCVAWVLAVAVFVLTTFQLMHGLNYKRTSVYDKLNLTDNGYTYEQYLQVAQWAFNGMVEARRYLGEDYNGVSHMQTNFETAVCDADASLLIISEKYDLDLSTNYIRAKAVSLSDKWSITGITGMYMPVLGEANVNTGYMSTLNFPTTLCHELCHAKGIASENQANFIAALTCSRSARADFRYSGYYMIFSDVASQLSTDDVLMILSEDGGAGVMRDMAAESEYWNNIWATETAQVVEETTEAANDAYLDANGQDGTQSYIVDNDYYVDFFYQYIV